MISSYVNEDQIPGLLCLCEMDCAFSRSYRMSVSEGLLRSLTLLVSQLCFATAAFPAFLPCNNQGKLTIDCSAHGLSKVPQFQTPTHEVTTLLLNANHITQIYNKSFSSFPSLRHLDLDWNCLQSQKIDHTDCLMHIEHGAFLQLTQLEELHLQGNGLKIIPPLLSSLQSLNLGYNQLQFWKPTKMFNLGNLKTLYMDGNCYYKNKCHTGVHIHKDFFAGMNELRNLSLGYNNLTEVPRNLPPSLELLFLHYNQIQSMHPGDFSGLGNLTTLDLQTSAECIPCLPGSVNLDSDLFANLSALIWLYLNDNSLFSLNKSLFVPLVNLEVLELSNNFLARETDNDSGLLLGEPTFHSCVKLKNLNLSFTYRKNTTFHKLYLSDDFIHMKALEKLTITSCFFQSVDEASIRPLAKLLRLNRIEHRLNFINKLNLQLFANKTSLKYIGLSENEITCQNCREFPGVTPSHRKLLSFGPAGMNTTGIQSDYPQEQQTFISMLHRCSPYKMLNLRKNNLVFIQPELFQGFEDIECLILCHNSISQAFDRNQFTNLKDLKFLDVSYNRNNLKGLFSELQSLEELDLSNNNYHFILSEMGHKLDSVAKLSSLRVLNLGFNSISARISQRVYRASVKEFIFRGNRLDIMWPTEIYFEFFQNLNNLTMLDLPLNHLTSLPSKVIQKLPSTLKSLYLLKKRAHLFPLGSTEKDFFHNATMLSSLNLSYNQMQRVEFTDGLLRTLSVLDIRMNPLICMCDSTFFELVSRFNISIPFLTNQVTCGSPYLLKDKSIVSSGALVCSDSHNVFLFFSLFLLTLLFVIVPMLKQFLGWDVWYAFYIWSARSWGLFTKSTESKDFDAFVVFDKGQGPVSDWVYNELRVHLEETGIHQLRLCLEERDWVPGHSSIENLYSAVQNSKKTVFVLSKGQPVCGILRETFFMAQQRLLDDKEDVMVFILLERALKGSRYLQLRRLLCRETVLVWPQNPCGRSYFWHRLRCVLSKDNQSYYDRNFSLSFEG
ncbi:toll-like receptor 9 [Acipenser ruthenus]|uniref:toll-like receptor 9 n=1 Tax=Acipenser ruthenus TaxID=7906 RepID=UPI002741BDDD|nr:toll-like receptor 9 [Acipenser ruthenus]